MPALCLPALQDHWHVEQLSWERAMLVRVTPHPLLRLQERLPWQGCARWVPAGEAAHSRQLEGGRSGAPGKVAVTVH